MEASRCEEIEEIRRMNGILVRLYILCGIIFAALVGGGIWILRRLLSL